MLYDFEQYMDVTKITNYYRQRGDFQVERIDNKSTSAKKYLVRVADRINENPIGWIFGNCWYHDDWGNPVDPIYAHQIKDARIERIFGRKLISGGRYYFQTGFWKKGYLTLSAADIATHIVFVNHCTNTTMCSYNEGDITRYGCEYYSKPSMMTAGRFGDMKNEVDSYGYFVFRIPDTEAAREVMLEITQENVTQKLKSMRAFQKYVTECKKYRPFFELLAPSAEERGLHLDLMTNIYRAILHDKDRKPVVEYCYAQKEYIDLSARLAEIKMHK